MKPFNRKQLVAGAGLVGAASSLAALTKLPLHLPSTPTVPPPTPGQVGGGHQWPRTPAAQPSSSFTASNARPSPHVGPQAGRGARPPALKAPAYDQLYADGVLNTVMAVGYDEGGSHLAQIRKTVGGLTERGYRAFDVKSASADQLQQVGLDEATVDRDATYYVKSFEYAGQTMKAIVKLITPETPNAKTQFARAMNQDEVVMYTGHGRYGSGPDFDDKASSAGNYVIGKPTTNAVVLGSNDLKRAKLTNGYQLMFFDGCNTKLFVDDLRNIPKNKNTSNLDIIGAATELAWDTSSDDLLDLLDGLESRESIKDIQSRLEANNKVGPSDTETYFMTSGF